MLWTELLTITNELRPTPMLMPTLLSALLHTGYHRPRRRHCILSITLHHPPPTTVVVRRDDFHLYQDQKSGSGVLHYGTRAECTRTEHLIRDHDRAWTADRRVVTTDISLVIRRIPPAIDFFSVAHLISSALISIEKKE